MDKLSIALQARGVVYVAPDALELWHGTDVPTAAATAALLIALGILCRQKTTP